MAREEHSAAGSLGALEFVFHGLEGLPGRKYVVLLSEGIPLQDEESGRSPLLTERLRRVTDAANRAATVVYSIDPSGLRPGSLGVGMATYLDQLRAGMTMLSSDTGGLMLGDTNDLRGALNRVLDDQRGFYVIGYAPEEVVGRHVDEHGSGYHRVDVRVKRPGLRVRSRSGYYALAQGGSGEAPAKTPQRQLIDAVTSPFAPSELHLALTPLFGYDAKRGAFVRCLLHVLGQLTHGDRPGRIAEICVPVLGHCRRLGRSVHRPDRASSYPEHSSEPIRRVPSNGPRVRLRRAGPESGAICVQSCSSRGRFKSNWCREPVR